MTLNTDNLTDGTGTAEAAEAGMDDKSRDCTFKVQGRNDPLQGIFRARSRVYEAKPAA